jgi:fatty acid desaturase
VTLPDYRLWWALFVFFAALSVLIVQRRYRRWQRAKAILQELPDTIRSAQQRRIRLEGWRLVLMVASLVLMTGLVFSAFLGVPAPVLLLLRVLAILSVLAVVVLGLLL